MNEQKHDVCPVENAGELDSWIRKILQPRGKIVLPYIHENMKILDFGCGPGYFTTAMAGKLKNGKVIAADLQEGMLDILKKKIQNTPLEEKISLHQCGKGSIGIKEKVNFILAFYVVHEVPDKDRLYNEFSSLLEKDGKLLIVEPFFHVDKKVFNIMIEDLGKNGFKIVKKPRIFFSHSVLLRK